MATDKKLSQYVSSVMTVEELIKSKTSAGLIDRDSSMEILKLLYDAREELESGDGKRKAAKFYVPSFEEVEQYFQVYSGNKSNSHSFTQVFMDFYTGNGWKIGKNSMKDWKATVRRWYNQDPGKYPNESTGIATPSTPVRKSLNDKYS